MTLEELLRTAAHDVADGAPDTYLAPADIRSRARSTRRRQRVGLAAGIAAATAVVAVGLQAVGGGAKDAQEPMPAPSPTPSVTSDASTAPGVAVVTFPEITPDDLREYAELRTVTNADAGSEGLTELTFEVPVTDRYTFEWSHFCSGDPDTWYVVVVGDGGASGSGYCDSPASGPFPALPTEISPFGHSDDNPATQVVRMFVVDEIPEKQQKCFDRKSPPECLDMEPLLEPLASTDVEFGISVYEYWAPSVIQVLGQDVAARASVDGTDYLLSQVLTPASGQHSFTATLPPAGGKRIVAVFDRGTDAFAQCVSAAGFDRDQAALCEALLGIRIGDRTVLLERGEFGDYPMLTRSSHGLFSVPAGDQEVELSVASGNPEHIDFALVVFEETL